MTTSAQSVDQFLKRYVQTRLKRVAGFGDSEIRAIIPLRGAVGLVRLLEVNGVLRGVLRVYDRSAHAEMKRRVLADDLAERHDLPMPRLLDVYEGDWTRLRATLEEFVPGRHFEPGDFDAERVQALAECLRRLHSVKSLRHGILDALGSRPFDRELRRMVRHRHRSVRRWAPALIGRDERRRVLEWFAEQALPLRDLKEFSLLHDKPNPGNLIALQERGDSPARFGGFAFVDLGGLCYGHPAKDIVQVEEEVLGDSPERSSLFRQTYFDGSSRETREGFRRVYPVFHAYYHLGQCAINCRREAKHGRSVEHLGSQYLRKSLEHWARLIEIIDEREAGAPRLD